MLDTGKWIKKRMNNKQLQVELNASELIQVSSQKLLGVTIDHKLSFDDHIDELSNKLCQGIAVLRRIKSFLPLEQVKAYYDIMIKQTMLYASNIRGICRGVFVPRSEVYALILTPTREQTVMNCLRDWIGFHFTSRSVKVNICVQVHKRINGHSPGYMSDLLVLNSDINDRNNRNSPLNIT